MAKEERACGSCGGCKGIEAACGDCTGCGRGGGELLLCREEIVILEELGQFAFLPLMTRREGDGPRYLPVGGARPGNPTSFSEAVESLLQKKLIVLDETLPIAHFDYGTAAQTSGVACGSLALTLQGQEALTLLALMPQTD